MVTSYQSPDVPRWERNGRWSQYLSFDIRQPQFVFHCLHLLIILGWPKSPFGFFHNILRKKPKRSFWPTQYNCGQVSQRSLVNGDNNANVIESLGLQAKQCKTCYMLVSCRIPFHKWILLEKDHDYCSMHQAEILALFR